MDESTSYSEDQFLSPDDSRTLLAALEDADARKLAPSRSYTVDEDEGSFISPGEDLDLRPKAAGTAENEKKSPGILPQPGTPVQELLSRIAREVQSIKAELGSLKSSQIEALPASPPDSRAETPAAEEGVSGISPAAYDEVKRLLAYLDRLLESLPESKVDEFARSEYFDLYRKVFEYFDLT
jgi:hypothetical protein